MTILAGILQGIGCILIILGICCGIRDYLKAPKDVLFIDAFERGVKIVKTGVALIVVGIIVNMGDI